MNNVFSFLIFKLQEIQEVIMNKIIDKLPSWSFKNDASKKWCHPNFMLKDGWESSIARDAAGTLMTSFDTWHPFSGQLVAGSESTLVGPTSHLSALPSNVEEFWASFGSTIGDGSRPQWNVPMKCANEMCQEAVEKVPVMYLALAGLLLLGIVAVPQHEDRWRIMRHSVILWLEKILKHLAK